MLTYTGLITVIINTLYVDANVVLILRGKSMSDVFEYVINQNVDPVRADLLKKGADLIEAMGFYNHWVEIENLMGLESQMDPFELMNDIGFLITDGLRMLLNNFSIQTNSDDIEKMIATVEGINTVEEYEDFDAVLAILDTEQSPEEKLAELVAMVTEYEDFDLLPVYDIVGARLLSKIESLFKDEPLDNEPYDMETSTGFIIQRLKEFMKEDRDYLIAGELENGMPLGLDPAIVLSKIENSLLDIPTSAIAEQLLAALLSSHLSGTEIVDFAKDYIEETFSDANEVSAINQAVVRLFGRVDNEQT